MSGNDAALEPDDVEAQFLELCEQLRERMAAKDGPLLVCEVEAWQVESQRQYPHLTGFIKNHIDGVRAGLIKSPHHASSVTNNFNTGGGVANAGSMSLEATAGGVNQLQAHTTSQGIVSTRDDNAPPAPTSSGLWWCQAAASVLLAVWWCLPPESSLGPLRGIVSVAAVAFVAFAAVSGWLGFRRRNWRSAQCFGFAALLIGKAVLPPFAGSLAGYVPAYAGPPLLAFKATMAPASTFETAVFVVGGVALIAIGAFSRPAD